MVGKDVICIDDKRTFGTDVIPNWPEENKVYKIRSVQNSLGGNGFGYLLEGIVNPRIPAMLNGQNIGSFEPGFSENRFTDLLGNSLSITLEKENVHSN